MRKIFTDVKKLDLDGINALPITNLSIRTQQWIVDTKKRLSREAVLPEGIAGRMFNQFDEKPVRQAYFQIRGRSYFVDFFFPNSLLVVEIDGSIHKFKKDHDRKRDADFRSIGIRTIRIKNKDVMSGKLYDKLYAKIYKT